MALMRHWPSGVIAGIFVLACGGKTVGSDPAGFGGSGASAGGTGGIGSGTGGAGPAGSAGISPGGSAGGGAGGGAGGSAGSGPGLIEAVCDKLAPLPCGPANCVLEGKKALQEALEGGCGDIYRSLLECVLTAPLACDDNGELVLPSVCIKFAEAFQQCIQPTEECAVYGGPGTCGMACSGWAVDCKQDPSCGLNCQCAKGPHVGSGFCASNLTCDYKVLSQVAGDICG